MTFEEFCEANTRNICQATSKLHVTELLRKAWDEAGGKVEVTPSPEAVAQKTAKKTKTKRVYSED